jgi:hypothetical protein
MPQRQVAIARSAIADLWIPRPSGAVNVIYYESTAGTVVKQALSPPAAPFVGYNVTGPGLKNKLATNCLGIVVASGAADQVFLTFDIAF